MPLQGVRAAAWWCLHSHGKVADTLLCMPQKNRLAPWSMLGTRLFTPGKHDKQSSAQRHSPVTPVTCT